MVHDKGYVKDVAKHVQPVKFTPKKVKIEVDEKDKNKNEQPVEIS